MVTSQTDLLLWLLARIKVKGFDSIKQYSSELLAILLQNDKGNWSCFLCSKENRIKVIENDGVDILLQVLASYKRRDPSEGDETEMVENIFDCLCSLLLENESKDKFVSSEGFELMILMLKYVDIVKY